MISETKLDDTFPTWQFLIDGFKTPFRLDRNKNGGGIMLFVREGIPAKFLSFASSPTEGFYVELNFRKKKWLVCCSYNPDKSNIKNHITALSSNLDIYFSQYEHFVVLEDFNVDIKNNDMKDFCNSYNLSSLIRVPTCYKNPNNPSCIDLILTNSPRSFQSSCAIETGLSYFHKMTITVMKASFQRLKPRVINYRNYNSFSNESYREELVNELSKDNLGNNTINICF